MPYALCFQQTSRLQLHTLRVSRIWTKNYDRRFSCPSRTTVAMPVPMPATIIQLANSRDAMRQMQRQHSRHERVKHTTNPSGRRGTRHKTMALLATSFGVFGPVRSACCETQRICLCRLAHLRATIPFMGYVTRCATCMSCALLGFRSQRKWNSIYPHAIENCIC